MEKSVHITFKKTLLSLAAFLLLHIAFAQPAPELVFKNAVLEQGIAGADGAVYRFSNITPGIDGLLEIRGRSHAAVVLEDIDVSNTGWDEPLQPRAGISGRPLAGQTWWMQFELAFVQSNSCERVTLNRFVAAPVDVDGDNVAVSEFVQMDNAKAVTLSSLTHLKTEAALPAQLFSPLHDDGDGKDRSFNLSGKSSRIVGPLTSFAGMDTTATAVMATFTYEATDAFTFVVGATSGAANGGIVGLRLHSLWFKNFDLSPQQNTPVAIEDFSAVYVGKTITLAWKATGEQNLSHFVVERSVDGRTYCGIARIAAAGGHAAHTYHYKDKLTIMSAGIAYYRLRLTGSDRTTSYSPVSTVYAKYPKGTNRVAVLSNAETNTISRIGSR